MKSLIYISLLFCLPIFSQNIVHDLTNEYENLNGGWSIGNACGELPFSKFEINDLDMKGDLLYAYNSRNATINFYDDNGNYVSTL